MNENQLLQPTDFDIQRLDLVTKFGSVDLRGMFEEINLYDSMLAPCATGNMLIVDAIGLSQKLLLDGTEYLLVEIDKGDGLFPIKRKYRVHSQTDRKTMNQTSESYILKFSSEELIFSEQQRVSHYYEGTYTEIILAIFRDYLKPDNATLTGVYDASNGLNKVVIPNLKPFDAIQWCVKRALNNNSKPNFMFFQNNDGYNLSTLDTIMSSEPLLNLTFSVKNLPDGTLNEEMIGVRHMQVMTQSDFIKNTRAGVYSGSVVGFDPVTRTLKKTSYTFNDIYEGSAHANPNKIVAKSQTKYGNSNYDMDNSRKIFYLDTTERQTTAYINENDPEPLQNQDTPQQYIFQRESILQNFVSQRLRLVIPGNFAVTSGKTLYLNVPRRGFDSDDTDNFDVTLKGKYAILATRHMIRHNRFETIVEAVTDSTERPEFTANQQEMDKQMESFK